MQKFDKCFGATGRNYGKVTGDRTMADIEKRRADRWNFLFIAGMWFQDLFNYDFRRTEQCIIPYATQEGEICFCAYNTGVGWRNIIEKMHMTATLTKWYEEHGRHEIFAGGKKVGMGDGAAHAGAEPGARERRGQRHAGQAGHRQERARREDARARRQAEAGSRKRADGEAVSRACAGREAGGGLYPARHPDCSDRRRLRKRKHRGPKRR